MLDIVFPNNNEREFIKIAEKLNIKELSFIYPYKKIITNEQLKSLQKTTRLNLKFGLLVHSQDILKAKRICSLVISESSEKDQYVLEKLKPNLIFNLEKSWKKDKTHYRLSGLNQVLCKLAAKNNTTIGFSFSTLLNSKKERRAILFGRIVQNLRFCNKYNVKTLFASFAKSPLEMRSPKDIESLLTVLTKKI